MSRRDNIKVEVASLMMWSPACNETWMKEESASSGRNLPTCFAMNKGRLCTPIYKTGKKLNHIMKKSCKPNLFQPCPEPMIKAERTANSTGTAMYGIWKYVQYSFKDNHRTYLSICRNIFSNLFWKPFSVAQDIYIYIYFELLCKS